MNRYPCWRVRALVALAILSFVHLALAQDKSVRPGINKPFENPDVPEYIGKFEVESREVFAQRKEIVAACQLQPGMKMADIGAGTGLFTRLFAKKVGPKGKVYAVDIASKFIKHIEKTCKDADIQNVAGVVCAADSVKLPPKSVDRVFICDTYHHFEFPFRTMASIHEALRPGGQVIVIDFHRIEGKSREWILNHVRAGQEVVVKEIESSGFKRVAEKKLLKENYFLVFAKVEAGKEPRTMLIQPAELQNDLKRPGLRLLDTRAQPDYAKGHIPGAVRVDVKSWQDLGKKDGGFHDAHPWGEKVGQLGLSHDSQVIVYGSALTDTARIWWTLKYLGLQNVALLDGGWALWSKERRPSETSSPVVEARKFEPKFQADRLEEIDSMKKAVRSGAVTVVDTRSRDEFTGQEVRGKRGGHIPGAKHLEWKELLAEDGRLKSPEQLRALFRRRGIEPEQTAVTC
ncbi:MAG TPA: rhodanese-like domain-containing protein [Gemmataceae bacterium]|jgi:3-mercaptopyruvate sulfurtransferase SseA/precorrin-6B methylase 2